MLYRGELAGHLVQEAKRLHGEAIGFHFQSPIAAVDLSAQTVTVSPTGKQAQVGFEAAVHLQQNRARSRHLTNGVWQTVRYDLLVGAGESMTGCCTCLSMKAEACGCADGAGSAVRQALQKVLPTGFVKRYQVCAWCSRLLLLLLPPS